MHYIDPNGNVLSEDEMRDGFDHHFEDMVQTAGMDVFGLLDFLWENNQDLYWDVVYTFEGALVRGEQVLGYERYRE